MTKEKDEVKEDFEKQTKVEKDGKGLVKEIQEKFDAKQNQEF